MKGNAFITQAQSQGRDYITPEDVTDVLSQWAAEGIAMHTARQLLAYDFLMILAGWHEFGIEDKSMCAHCLLEMLEFEFGDRYQSEPISESSTPWICTVVGFRGNETKSVVIVPADSVHQACRRAARKFCVQSEKMGSYRMVIESVSPDGQTLVYVFKVTQGVTRVLNISEPKQFVVKEGRHEVPVSDSVCIMAYSPMCSVGRRTVH